MEPNYAALHKALNETSKPRGFSWCTDPAGTYVALVGDHVAVLAYAPDFSMDADEPHEWHLTLYTLAYYNGDTHTDQWERARRAFTRYPAEDCDKLDERAKSELAQWASYSATQLLTTVK